MLEAWVGIFLLAENDWFYASPTSNSAPPSRNFGESANTLKERKKAIHKAKGYYMLPANGKYQCIALDFRLCFFDLSSSRSWREGLCGKWETYA